MTAILRARLSQKFPAPLMRVGKWMYSQIPMRARTGNEYWQLKAFLREAQWWDRKRIEAWQLNKLQEIVRYAYENVPGYYTLYKEAGINPKDVVNLADVKFLPFTTKELLRDNLDDFTSGDIPSWQRKYITTGGSTGIPLGFYHTDTNHWMEKAFIHSSWERTGWRLGDTSAVLRGAFVGSEELFWERDPINRELLLSSYHLSERTYSRYSTKLVEHRPKHLQAYPSMATTLADLIVENGDVGTIDFKVILLGSENIFEWQKKRIRAAFPKALLFGWYGLSEQAVLATWCEHYEYYHDWPFYGLTEILKEDDEPALVGHSGEVVGTSFWSHATPIIRYRTMDLVQNDNWGCDHCGRQFLIMRRFIGRAQNTLVSASGRQIPVPSMGIHDDLFDKVRQFQFYQDTPGEVVFRVVRKDSYAERDTAKIRQKLMQKLGEDMALEIRFVEKISRTSRGKYMFLEQKLNTNNDEQMKIVFVNGSI